MPVRAIVKDPDVSIDNDLEYIETVLPEKLAAYTEYPLSDMAIP